MSKEKSKIVNKLTLVCHGLKRSGHHGVMNWILQQAQGEKWFINDVKSDKNPFQTRNAYSEMPGERKTQAEGKFVDKDLLLYSYEDKYMNAVITPGYRMKLEKWIGKSERTIHAIVLRDPFNHFASRLKANRKGAKWAWGAEDDYNAYYYAELWKSHAREFLSLTHNLPYDKVFINFNQWCQDKDYRKKVMKQLGIPFTDEGFKEVPRAGGGSAFSGRKYDGKANEMELECRWKDFVGDPYFTKIFDNEILDLNRMIWPDKFGTIAKIIRAAVLKGVDISDIAKEEKGGESKEPTDVPMEEKNELPEVDEPITPIRRMSAEEIQEKFAPNSSESPKEEKKTSPPKKVVSKKKPSKFQRSPKGPIKNVLLDFRNIDLFLDKLNHTPEILYDLGLYLQRERGVKVFFHMLSGGRKFLKAKAPEQNPKKLDLKYKVIKFDRNGNTPKIIDEMGHIDFYLGFCGFKHRGKRKFCQEHGIPNMVYEAGALKDSLLIDKTSIYGDGYTSKRFDEILSEYPINDTPDYCQETIDNNISKRTQAGNDPIPEEPFIFIPGQAMRDTSITRCSKVGLLPFITMVSEFAAEHALTVVFKPHPGLIPGKVRHGLQEQLDHCAKFENIKVVRNSVFNINKKAMFVASVNCASIVDSFMCQVPVYVCGKSFFMRSGAVLYDPDVKKGLDKMYREQFDAELMLKRQMRVISWLRDNLLFKSLPPEENVRRLENLAGVKFNG